MRAKIDRNRAKVVSICGGSRGAAEESEGFNRAVNFGAFCVNQIWCLEANLQKSPPFFHFGGGGGVLFWCFGSFGRAVRKTKQEKPDPISYEPP